MLICDRDTVIASAGVPKKEYAEKALSPELERLCESRSVFSRTQGSDKLYPIREGSAHFVRCAAPIVSEGDIVGCVVSLAPADSDATVEPTEQKLVQTAASFLGRQLEG